VEDDTSEKKSNIHLLLVPLFLLVAPIVVLVLVLLADSTADRVLKKDYPQKYWKRKIKVMESRLQANNDERDNLIIRLKTRLKESPVAKKGNAVIDGVSFALSGAEKETLNHLDHDIQQDEEALGKARKARKMSAK